MGFAAPRSVVSNRLVGLLGCPLPRTSAVSSGRRGLPPTTVPRHLSAPGSSSHELYASSEPADPRPLRECTFTEPFLGVSSPFATSTERIANETGFPTPPPAPSSGFLTLPTVSSSLGLAGLFHPAATSGVLPTGVCPAPQQKRLVGVPCPLVVARQVPAPRCQGAPGPAVPPPGLSLRVAIRCAPQAVTPASRPIPSWDSPLPGAPVPR